MTHTGKTARNRIAKIAVILIVVVALGSMVQGSIGSKSIVDCLKQNCLIAAILFVLGVLSVLGGAYVSYLKKSEEAELKDTAD